MGGGLKGGSVSGSALTNGSAELAAAQGSTNGWSEQPQGNGEIGVFTC